MRFKLLNWIETAYWQGALIEDNRGEQYLTNGINIWTITPARNYKIVESIDENQFYKYWKEYFPFSSLTESK